MADPSKRGEAAAGLVCLAGLALVSFVYFPSGYDFANLPKLLILMAFGAIASAVMVRRSLSGHARSISPVLLGFIAFSWVQLLRSLNAGDAAVPVFVLTGSVALAYAYLSLTDSRENLFTAIVWVGGVVAFIGVLESWGISWAQLRSAGRPSATLGFRNTAAAYIAGCLPFGVYLATRKDRLRRVSGVFAASIMLLFIVYSRSRGAWLGVGMAAVAFGGWYAWSCITGRQAWLRPRLAAIPVLVILLVLALGSVRPSFDDNALSRLDEKKQSVSETVRSLTTPGGDRDRLTVWGHTLDMVGDHILIGTGPGNWSTLYPRYDRGDVLHLTSAPRRPHNDYLWVASELGIVGIGLLLWCLGSALVSAVRRDEAWRIAAACSVIGIGVHSAFSFHREQAAPTLILWLAVAVCLGVRQSGQKVAGATWACLAVACGFGFSTTLQSVRADQYYGEALSAQRTGQLQRQAETAMTGTEIAIPDHRLYLLLGNAQMELQQYDEAVETFTEYASIQPYLGAVANNLGHALNSAGDHAQAERVLVKGREVLPGDRALIRNLSEAYRRQGKSGAALRLYSEIDTKSADDHVNLAILYAEMDSLDVALSHYGRALDLDPGRSEVLYSVAGVYMVQGRLGDAIKGFQTYLKSESGNPTLTRRAIGRLKELYVGLAGRMMTEGDAPGAVSYLKERSKLGEMTAGDHHMVAVASAAANDHEGAETEARIALRMDETLTIARLTLANALYAQRKREAFDHYARFVDEWVGDPALLDLPRKRLESRP